MSLLSFQELLEGAPALGALTLDNAADDVALIRSLDARWMAVDQEIGLGRINPAAVSLERYEALLTERDEIEHRLELLRSGRGDWDGDGTDDGKAGR